MEKQRVVGMRQYNVDQGWETEFSFASTSKEVLINIKLGEVRSEHEVAWSKDLAWNIFQLIEINGKAPNWPEIRTRVDLSLTSIEWNAFDELIGNNAKPGKVIPEMTIVLPATSILPSDLFFEENESMGTFAEPINYKFKVRNWPNVLNRLSDDDFCLEAEPSIEMQILEKIVDEQQ